MKPDTVNIHQVHQHLQPQQPIQHQQAADADLIAAGAEANHVTDNDNNQTSNANSHVYRGQCLASASGKSLPGASNVASSSHNIDLCSVNLPSGSIGSTLNEGDSRDTSNQAGPSNVLSALNQPTSSNNSGHDAGGGIHVPPTYNTTEQLSNRPPSPSNGNDEDSYSDEDNHQRGASG